MSEKIRPALSPDEWSGEDNVVLGTGSSKMGHFIMVNEWRQGPLDMDIIGRTEWVWDGPDRHKVAAIALYRQPFGLTQRDADVLRVVARDHEFQVLRYNGKVLGNMGEMLGSLADRIEALLPSKPDNS